MIAHKKCLDAKLMKLSDMCVLKLSPLWSYVSEVLYIFSSCQCIIISVLLWVSIYIGS